MKKVKPIPIPKPNEHHVKCDECGETDEPHKHCMNDGCMRWTIYADEKCDDCLLEESRRNS